MPPAKYGELLGMENELRVAHPISNPCCRFTLRACLPIILWNGGESCPRGSVSPVYYFAESVNPYLWGTARKPTHSEDIGLWIAMRWPCSPNSTKKRSWVVLNHKVLQWHSCGLRTEKLLPSWPLTLHGLWEFVLTLMGAALHLSGPPAVTGQWLSCSWYRVLLYRSDPIPVWPLETEGLLRPITPHSASKASSCS